MKSKKQDPSSVSKELVQSQENVIALDTMTMDSLTLVQLIDNQSPIDTILFSNEKEVILPFKAHFATGYMWSVDSTENLTFEELKVKTSDSLYQEFDIQKFRFRIDSTVNQAHAYMSYKQPFNKSKNNIKIKQLKFFKK